MNMSDTKETIVKKANNNDIGILKFLDNEEVNMTVLNSIILLAIFFIVSTLILVSNKL